MSEKSNLITLDELSALVNLPKRTIRYYIQIGLIDRPQGAGRGAHYRTRHVEQLIEIRKWQQAGLSLERIRELLTSDGEALLPPVKPQAIGAAEVRSHVLISQGVSLTVDPARSRLSPEKVRALADGVIRLYEAICNDKEQK